MAGFKVVAVACDAHGNIEIDDLRAQGGRAQGRRSAR